MKITIRTGRVAAFFLIAGLVFSQVLHAAPAREDAKAKGPAFAERGSVFPRDICQLKGVFFTPDKIQSLYQSSGFSKALAKTFEDNQPFVFLIEDAHSSLGAQRNIADLIRFIRDQWQVKLLALEGAQGEVSLKRMGESVINESREAVLEFYLKESLLSGPEYAVLSAPKDFLVRGVEIMELYEADRKAYLDLYDNRVEIDQKISEAAQKLEAEKEKVFTPELLIFDKKEEAFESNRTKNLSVFLPFCLQTASAQGLRLPPDSALAFMSRTLETSRNVSLKSVEEEIALFRKESPYFKNELDVLEKQFLPRGFDLDFNVTGPPPEIPLIFIYRFKAIQAYLNLARFQYEAGSEEFFYELDPWIQKTKNLLARTPEARSLIQKEQAFASLKRILRLEALRGDLVNRETAVLASEMGLEKFYATAKIFYELAKKRDEVLTAKTLEAIQETAVQPKAATLVVGGFHTAGIQEILRNMKVSFAVLAPRFQAEDIDDNLYRNRLKGDLSLKKSFIPPKLAIFDSARMEDLETVAEAKDEDPRRDTAELYQAVTARGHSLGAGADDYVKKDPSVSQRRRIIRLESEKDLAGVYGDIIKLYRHEGPLRGKKELVTRLGRLAWLSYLISAEMSKSVFKLSGEERHDLLMAALIFPLGRASSEITLKMYQMLSGPEMSAINLEAVKSVSDEAQHILKEKNIPVSDKTLLLVRTLDVKEEPTKTRITRKGLEESACILKIASLFAEAIVRLPHSRLAGKDGAAFVDDWVKKMTTRDIVYPEIQKATTKILKRILREAVIDPDRLSPGVSQPDFQERIYHLSVFHNIAIAIGFGLLFDATTPEAAYDFFQKKLSELKTAGKGDPLELAGIFDLKFFTNVKNAYRDRDEKRYIQLVRTIENVLKELVESVDPGFYIEHQKHLAERILAQKTGNDVRIFVVAEDMPEVRWYLEMKLKKRNPNCVVYAYDNPEAALDRIRNLRRQGKDKVILISDLEMGPDSMSGWDLAKAVRGFEALGIVGIAPSYGILIQTSVYDQIEANVDGVMHKGDLLFLEYVVDLMEEKMISDASSVSGASLGRQPPEFSDEKVIQVAAQNIRFAPVLARLILPVSELPFLDRQTVEAALSNRNNVIDIVWGADPKPAAERLSYLESIGWADFVGKENFHDNISNKTLDDILSLKGQAERIAASLRDKKISENQVIFLKPSGISDKVNGVLSLRSGERKGVSLFLMLYLAQIQGDPALNLLDGLKLKYNEKTGDFSYELDSVLERLMLESLAQTATRKAA